MGTKPSPFQPGHDGKVPRVPVAFGADNAHDRTRVGEHVQQHRLGNIALDSHNCPKAHNPVLPHMGQHSRTRDGNLIVGVTQTTLANAPDASGARPLDPTIPGKRIAPAPAYPGMRSRRDEVTPGAPGEYHARNRGNLNHDLGAAVLDEARRTGSR
jgi:hypothetical protein